MITTMITSNTSSNANNNNLKLKLTLLLCSLLCCWCFIIHTVNSVATDDTAPNRRFRPTRKVFDIVEKIGVGVLTGPESVVWDSQGNTYTGISDGTIRMINATTGEITIYAYSVSNLSEEQRAKCGTSVTFESVCGRPLGLQFDRQENLLVADAYMGILNVSRHDPSNVTVIVDRYQDVRFKMVNSLYLTSDESTLYFTDSSQQYSRFEFVSIVVSNAPDSRLFKYDMATGALTVEISDLRFGNGIAVSRNEQFLLINECSARSIRKYFLKGVRAGENTVLVRDIGGYNDNIRPDGSGNFYVGLFSNTSDELSAIQAYPELQALTLQYIPPASILGLITPMGLVKKINDNGRVIEIIQSANATVLSSVAEADVHNGYLYLGSVLNNYLGRVALSDIHRV